MKKSILIFTGCFLFATTIVVVLYAINNKIVHQPNNFLRTYETVLAKKFNELDLKYNSFYIAGITDNHVYLGNVMIPFLLIKSNYTLTDTQYVRLSVRNMENMKFYASVSVKIDSPYFYIADGHMPGLFRGKLDEWIADRFMYDSIYFSQLVPISKTSFAIRTQARKNLEHILGKVQRNEPHEQFNSDLLQKQIDGFFCTDGALRYNKHLKRLVYTYYYRNEYIVYDTNLNLDYRGHTIDTFSRAQIKIGHISSENSNTLTYSKTINLKSYTSGNYLFINSNLLAKNDMPNMLKLQSIIDVYDLRNNTYKFSFTVTNFDKEDRIKDFMVFGNKTLIVLFEHHAVVYELHTQYFL